MIKYDKKVTNFKTFQTFNKTLRSCLLKVMRIVGVVEKFRNNTINFGCGHAFLNKLKNAI